MIHKTDGHAVSYAVARIMALEELVRELVENDGQCMDNELREQVEELVPDEDTFDNDDPDSTAPTDEEE